LARVVIEVKNHEAEIFWDSIRLPGGPFPLDRIRSGFIGVTRPTPAAAASPRPRSTASRYGFSSADHINLYADYQTDKLDATGFATFIPLTSCVMEFLLNKN
jgi:hypothetical protein